MFNKAELKNYFPMLNARVNDKPLIYLDNAATTLKSQNVIDALTRYYTNETANIHRGIHHFSELSTSRYEASRDCLQKLINAKKREEIIFTKGTTDSINLLASSLGQSLIKEDDEIIISGMEHHSNIVPWQMLCERSGAKLKVINLLEDGTLDIEHYKSLLTEKTKIVSVVYISNSLGTINPIKDMIAKAHDNEALFIVDAAQAVSHHPIDVQELDCDFLALSAHKMFGPTGIGILYGREKLLEQLPPYQGGGDMIDQVSFEKTTYNHLPHKFEAGTPPIASGIGFQEAVKTIEHFTISAIEKYEKSLLHYAMDKMQTINGIRFIGQAEHKTSIISFTLEGIHHQDLATLLDKMGIAIRTGHHCTQPLMSFFKVPGTARASFSFYNDFEDIDLLVNGIKKIQSMFA